MSVCEGMWEGDVSLLGALQISDVVCCVCVVLNRK